MKSIINHLLTHQRKNGPEGAFKFKSIKFKGKTVPADYDDRETPPNLRSIPGSTPSRPHNPSIRASRAALSGPRDIGPTGASGPIISGPDSGAVTAHSLSHSPTQTPNKDLPTSRDTETGMDHPHNTTNNNKSRLKPRALTKN